MQWQDARPFPPPVRLIRRSAARARAVVMEVERQLGFDPTDRELEKLGYDIESRVLGTGKLRFIEVRVVSPARQRSR